MDTDWSYHRSEAQRSWDMVSADIVESPWFELRVFLEKEELNNGHVLCVQRITFIKVITGKYSNPGRKVKKSKSRARFVKDLVII